MRACDGSLPRLGLEQIPLYQFHRPDPRVPLEESVGALVELKQQGKIRHIGLSNVDADQLARAPSDSTPIVSVQNRYNLTDRSSESMVDLCEQQGSPSCRGRRSRTSTRPVVQRDRSPHDASERQVTLAWLLARSSVMLPIPGTGSPTHVEDNVAAAGLRLDDDEIAALNAAGNKDSRLRRSLRSARSSLRSRTSRGDGSSAR